VQMGGYFRGVIIPSRRLRACSRFSGANLRRGRWMRRRRMKVLMG